MVESAFADGDDGVGGDAICPRDGAAQVEFARNGTVLRPNGELVAAMGYFLQRDRLIFVD